VLLALVLSVPAFVACSLPRYRELWVYNWGYFMHPEVFTRFEDYMLSQHGESIRVRGFYFDSNETAYRTIAEQGLDRDIVVPSDYMVYRLRAGGYLQPLDHALIASELEIHYGLGHVSSIDFRDLLREEIYRGANESFDQGLLYSMPFLWGTLGIMYNRNIISNANDIAAMRSWGSLFGAGGISQRTAETAPSVFMKSAQVRDNYAAAMLFYFSDELRARSNNLTDFSRPEYIELMTAIFTDFSHGAVQTNFWYREFNIVDPFDHAVEILRQQRRDMNVVFEMDTGMFNMQQNIPAATAGLAWSTDAGFVMNDNPYAPVADMLYYVVPEEGANLWINNLVIPRNAGNYRLANKFIAFSLREDISQLNTLSTGSPAANHVAMVELEETLRADNARWEGRPAHFKPMVLDLMFPSDNVLERSFVMGDFGARFGEGSLMWNRVTAPL